MTAGMQAAFGRLWPQVYARMQDGIGGVAPRQAAAGGGTLALFFDLRAWHPCLQDAWSLLDGPERARVQRKRLVDDRDELALAYALHRLTLGCVLGVAPAEVPLGRDAAGRPCLAGEVLQTSLSHARGAAAVAVSRRGPVGIDLEPAARVSDMPAIAEHVLHALEARDLAGLPEAERGMALLELWVRKEALLKAAGIGLSREMHSLVAPIGQRVPLPLVGGGDGSGRVTLRMLDAGPRWLAALACTDDAEPGVAWLHPPSS